jgi:hypothetical protein
VRRSLIYFADEGKVWLPTLDEELGQYNHANEESNKETDEESNKESDEESNKEAINEFNMRLDKAFDKAVYRMLDNDSCEGFDRVFEEEFDNFYLK